MCTFDVNVQLNFRNFAITCDDDCTGHVPTYSIKIRYSCCTPDTLRVADNAVGVCLGTYLVDIIMSTRFCLSIT